MKPKPISHGFDVLLRGLSIRGYTIEHEPNDQEVHVTGVEFYGDESDLTRLLATSGEDETIEVLETECAGEILERMVV